MSHFIRLNTSLTQVKDGCSYLIRADRIDWIAERGGETPDHHTVVCVNGKELLVEEPEHLILRYIKDPRAPIVPVDEFIYNPTIFKYEKKYGEVEGRRRYSEDMHYLG